MAKKQESSSLSLLDMLFSAFGAVVVVSILFASLMKSRPADPSNEFLFLSATTEYNCKDNAGKVEDLLNGHEIQGYNTLIKIKPPGSNTFAKPKGPDYFRTTWHSSYTKKDPLRGEYKAQIRFTDFNPDDFPNTDHSKCKLNARLDLIKSGKKTASLLGKGQLNECVCTFSYPNIKPLDNCNC
jgi:hypothetical protein